jgi:hypothetical protein
MIFVELQDAITARLREDEVLGVIQDLPILTENHSALLDKLAVALAKGKPGLSFVVSTPKIIFGQEGRTPETTTATISIVVSENIALNRSGSGTRLPALDAALRAWVQLNAWEPGNGWTRLVPISLDTIDVQPLLTYELVLETHTELTVTVSA